CSLLTPPFLFRYTPPTALPTLSLHDALPIYPIPPYVVDFYCANARLIVEVDGFAHDNAERAARDALRDQALIEKGYDVLRLPASDRKSTRLNSSHVKISYAVFCLKKKNDKQH